jgi:DGQHR domain-containing protein
MRDKGEKIVVRALKAKQGAGVDVYSFFLFGSAIARVADISRVGRGEDGELRGFQRKEIRAHVDAIVEFLDSGAVLFPNAIILALSPEVEFKQSRGPRPDNMLGVADAGTLTIPVRREGRRVAWIVDGQQRSLALARAKDSRLSVPVVGFVAPDLATQREQFVLVNKAKPLPTRLINELLPEIGAALPRDLAAKKLPSELCNALARDTASPFYGLVKRESDGPEGRGVVTDTALIEAIRRNLRGHTGALRQYCHPITAGQAGSTAGDAEEMYRVLALYWSAVRDAFPEAWGRPPLESRLMHSAGIRAMGMLMDPIMLRADSSPQPDLEIREALARLAPHCRWTDGVWEGLGWRWNEVQSTAPHISRLGEYLAQLDRDLSRRGGSGR